MTEELIEELERLIERWSNAAQREHSTEWGSGYDDALENCTNELQSVLENRSDEKSIGEKLSEECYHTGEDHACLDCVNEAYEEGRL